MRHAAFLFTALATTALGFAADPPKHEPPVEQRPADPKAAKIVLVAGSNYFKAGEHEYVANCAVLADLLKQTPNVAPVLALDWPKKAETFDGAKAVVFLFDGADKHQAIKVERPAQVQKLMDTKVGPGRPAGGPAGRGRRGPASAPTGSPRSTRSPNTRSVRA